MYNKLPFFENTKIHEGKNLNDKIVIKDFKKDLDLLTSSIQSLPFLTKSYLSFTKTDIYIFNSKRNLENIIKNNNISYNLNELKKNINSLKNILSKNKQYDKHFKNFLGENYSSDFNTVCNIVNQS